MSAVQKVRFLRAKGHPTDPEYDAAADDTEGMAFGTMLVGISGWLECAACGAAKTAHGAVLVTPEGHRYAYGLCNPCHGAMHEFVHFEAEKLEGEGEIIASPWGSTGEDSGPIGRRIDEAHDRFVADGEPEPRGPGWRE